MKENPYANHGCLERVIDSSCLECERHKAWNEGAAASRPPYEELAVKTISAEGDVVSHVMAEHFQYFADFASNHLTHCLNERAHANDRTAATHPDLSAVQNAKVRASAYRTAILDVSGALLWSGRFENGQPGPLARAGSLRWWENRWRPTPNPFRK